MSVMAVPTSEAQVTASLRGVDVVVDLVVDPFETRRRTEAGIAGRRLGGIGALRALLALPEGVGVPVERLDLATWTALGHVRGAVEYPAAGVVRRLARPAVWAQLVSIPASRWRDGLRLAGRFAPYASRQIMINYVPTDAEMLCLEASYWGVGVTVAQDGAPARELVPPSPFVPTRYTAAAWNFDEDLYAQL